MLAKVHPNKLLNSINVTKSDKSKAKVSVTETMFDQY